MNLNQFFSIVRARWWLGLMVAALTTAAGLGYSLRSPKTYTASATVMLDLVSPELNGGFAGVLLPSYLATQVDLLGSERVALKAVDLLGIAQDPALHESWMTKTEGAGEFKVWLAQSLHHDLEIKPSRESNVISIRYSAEDPKYAARVANAFVQAYAETSIELRAEPARQYQSVYRERAESARQAVETAQAKLTAFQRAQGLLGAGGDGKADLEAMRLAELSSQLTQLQALANESQTRRNEVTRGAERLAEVRGDPAVAQIRIDLAREQGRMLELDQRLGASNPQVVEQKALIEELQQRLATAVRTASGALDVGNSVNQARLTQLQAAIAAQRAKVERLRAVRDDADLMQRDLDNARQAYDGVLQRLNQTEMAGRSAQANVSVVQVASPPIRPSGPKTALNTIAALLAGSVMGLSLIVLVELRDRRVRTADEIVGEMQQTLLLAMPKVQFLQDKPSSPGARRFHKPEGVEIERQGLEM